MFTGIVIDSGVVKRSRDGSGMLELEIEAPGTSRELKPGDSVAVNGVCLTAVEAGRRHFSTQAMPETRGFTTIGELKRGRRVNLELPLRIGDRLGGHFLQGHVDGVATAVRIEDDDGAKRIWWRADDDVLRYLAPKGSVALDGVSLTVVEVGRTSFQVAVIPHTLEVTTLGSTEVGTNANVEVDVIAKYVERLMERGRR
jgi:riboflavin synthase